MLFRTFDGKLIEIKRLTFPNDVIYYKTIIQLINKK